MNLRTIVVRELEERYLTLARRQSDFLLRQHWRHLELRPAALGRSEWLLRARDCCGIIALPGAAVLHIEPKARIANLWQLLVGAHDLLELGERRVGLEAAADLLQSLAGIFVSRCERILDNGLVHGYRSRDEDLRALRGTLDLTRNLRRAPAARHLLSCRYDDYTPDVRENRVLRWALYRLSRMRYLADSTLRARAERCAARMTPVELAPVTQYDFTRLHFDNLNRHYRTPLALAELLLAAQGVTHRPGDFELPSMLLDMPVVFERFVTRLLATALRGTPLRVCARAHTTALDDHGRMVLTPDVLVTAHGIPMCVVDAKYKLTGSEAIRRPPSAEDVYQMLAYCVGYQVDDAVLVYPEPLQSHRPLTVTRPGFTARVHAVGLDLSGDAASFDAACKGLVQAVTSLAEVGV